MARSSLSDSEAEAYDINSSASVPMAVKACKCDLGRAPWRAVSSETLHHCSELKHFLGNLRGSKLLKLGWRGIVFDTVLVKQRLRKVSFYREIDVLGKQPRETRYAQAVKFVNNHQRWRRARRPTARRYCRVEPEQ